MLKLTADMYRLRLFEIREKKFNISKQQVKLNEAIRNLQSQLNEWNSKDNEASGQIILTLSSNSAITGSIAIRN